jgi:hypothetical protein
VKTGKTWRLPLFSPRRYEGASSGTLAFSRTCSPLPEPELDEHQLSRPTFIHTRCGRAPPRQGAASQPWRWSSLALNQVSHSLA